MLRYYRVFIIFMAMLVPVMAGAVDITISGKIVDRLGNPVPGVRFIAGPLSPVVGVGFGGPSVRNSYLFLGVPAECVHYSSSGVRTNASGDYQLLVIFDENLPVTWIPHKKCADYRGRINRANMKLAPHPDDVRKYDLIKARGPLPQYVRSRHAREQVLPAGNPAPRGGFTPRR